MFGVRRANKSFDNICIFVTKLNKVKAMDFDKAGSSNVRDMTRKHLFSIMMTEDLNNINEKLQFLERYVLKFGPFSDEDMKKNKQDLSRFKSVIKKRWTDSHYKEDLILKNNATWLEGTFVIPKVAIRTGRPHKCVSEL
ncbi:hypothetical protein PYW08_013393 [Mythimna loreyi]|uniref:Uncharacterized protein n=1 Tax=Mythimna loreyi TaxID=667449 RepID=A0ACC2QFF5_9NEOP|nr:hypothetical protein PYW08_013393 [Mythimna loreyi]